MRILIIDTATEAFSIALFENGSLISHCHEVVGRGHAERLLPAIAGFPEGGRADEIWVDCGPGSFTGIRVGIAAAKGLGLAWSVPVKGYRSTELIDTGAGLINPDWRGKVRAVVMEGGHGEWFVSLPAEDGMIESLSAQAALEKIGTRPTAGSKADAANTLRGAGVALNIFPDARWGIEMPQSVLCAEASPVYVRGADAKKMTQ